MEEFNANVAEVNDKFVHRLQKLTKPAVMGSKGLNTEARAKRRK